METSWARIVPWAVLALGLATTAFFNVSILHARERRRLLEFEAARRSLSDDVSDIVRHQASLLYATAGAMESDAGMTQTRFTIFYNKLLLGESFRPEAIGFTAFYPWAERGKLAQQATRRKAARFEFRPLDPRPEAHAIILLEPLTGTNVGVLGYDMHSEPMRRRAMDRALANRVAAMTDRIILIQDKARGANIPAVLMYVPVFDPVTGRPFGHVYSALHTQPLFESLFPEEMESSRIGLSLRLWTGPKDGAHLIYSHTAGGEPEMRVDTDLNLTDVDHNLHAEFVMTDRFGTQAIIQRFVVPVGTAVSVMLFLLAWSLGWSHRTTARRAREQGLLNEVGRLAASGAEDDATLREIARQVSEVLEAACRIDLLQPDGSLRTIDATGAANEAASLERRYPRLEHDPLLRAAIETGATQQVDRFVPADVGHRQAVAALGVGPVLVVPMRVRGRFVGALTLVRAVGRRRLSREAVAVVEAVAGRLALGLDNARLYRAAQEELRVRTAAEAEVRRLNEGLEEIVAERTRDLEASNHELESFCYSVSHDLRTPLRSLDGFGRALKEDYGEQLDEQAHDYIDRIRSSTKRMDELITALLTLSRLTRREIVPSDVDATVMARETMMDLDPQGKVAFTVQKGLRVQADPRMLGVVLENLLGNAVKFSGRAENPRIEVGRAEDGALFVRDNGAGFDPAYGAKLFQPFERLHSVREFPGHGIGLATVERILRRHGGTVRAEGRPGDGATFYVRFPE